MFSMCLCVLMKICNHNLKLKICTTVHLFLCLGVLMLLFFISCSKGLQEEKLNLSPNELTQEVAKEVEILYSDSATVRIKITAPTLINHSDQRNPYEEFPNGVRLDFFDPQQQTISVLTAKHGFRYPLKDQVILRDSAVWESLANKERLESPELIWDEKLQKVYSKKLVIITTPTEKIWGYGFETNQDFTRWQINLPQGHLAVDK